jgi:eukaryotic-like serine/threonine-protein kinase
MNAAQTLTETVMDRDGPRWTVTPLARLADDWPALNALLDEALALPAAERQTWLRSLRERPGLTAPLRDSLQRLLAVSAEIETGDFLNTLRPMAEAAPALGLPAGGPQAGDSVGPWRLLRLLGEGGMGQVFLAERTDGVLKRPVALKLPRLSWMQGLAERLARERDILATLEHPHIARLYDAGVDEAGRPWLALEYLEGQSLDEHCRAHGLGWRERLGLVLQACDAVAYAHGRLVIHRDLKPGNLLVTADGQLRLLDFGIAKLLGDEDADADASALTRQQGRAMTLAYASPEQVRGERLGTASDQYSLAVVAYELLAGCRPYRLQHGSAAELEHAVLEVDAPPASRRAEDPAQARLLRGDLDAILAKALSKAVDRRHASVAAFADDLRRHLAGEPVLARAPTRRYRVGKWLLRHRLPVLAGTAVALSLVLGAAVAVRQAALALEAEAVAQVQRQRAEAAGALAQASEREARAAQANAVAEGEKARRAEAAARASATQADRERQRAQGLAAAERSAAEQARRQTRRAQQEGERAGVVGNFMLNSLGRMAADPALVQQGGRALMGAALETELQHLDKAVAGSPAGVAEAHGAAASVFNYLQQPERQLAAARREQRLLRQAGEPPLRLAESHRQLALALSRRGDTSGAIAEAEAGLAVAPRGPALVDRVMRARLHRALARYQRGYGRVAQAHAASQAAVRAFDGVGPKPLRISLEHLGSALAEHAINASALGRSAEAVAALARVDRLYAAAGPASAREADRADVEFARCQVLLGLEQHDAAAQACVRAVALYTPQFGATGTNTDRVDSLRATALTRAGRLDEAGALLQRIREGGTGVTVWTQSAEWAIAGGHLEQAQAWLERQAAHPSQALPVRRLGLLRQRTALRLRQGRPEEAAADAREALALVQGTLPGSVLTERLVLLDLAEAEHAAGREAVSIWQRACSDAKRAAEMAQALRRCAALQAAWALGAAPALPQQGPGR